MRMKIIESISRLVVLGSVAVWLGLSAGCGQKTEAPRAVPASAASATTPAIASAETNSFREVTAQLDPGGNLYLYLSTQQWLEGLSAKIGEWEKMLLGLPGMGPDQAAGLQRFVDLAKRFVAKSGVEEVSGLGASSIASEKGLYHSKVLIHHYPGRKTGALWNLFGTAPHPLTDLNGLPTNSVLAASSDINLAGLWQWVDRELSEAGIPEVDDWRQTFPAQFEAVAGLAWTNALSALGTSIGVVLTLDEARMVSLPIPQQALEIPEAELAILLKVNNDTLFNRVDQLLKDNPAVVREDKGSTRMRTLVLPLPIPFPFRPTLAIEGNFLLLASTDRLAKEVLALRQSPGKGLKSTAEFKRLSQNLPLDGNRFVYVSAALGRAFQGVLQNLAQAQANGGEPWTMVFQNLQGAQQAPSGFWVAQNGEQGWLTVANTTQNPVGSVLAPAVVAPVAIGAAMVLPALAQAKSRAQSIKCVNNLKNIGLAGRVWATDHQEKLPPDWLAMKNELSSPQLLFCPADPEAGNHQNETWDNLDLDAISYEMVSPGAGETEPNKVFVRCRRHGHECLVDGSVQMKNRP